MSVSGAVVLPPEAHGLRIRRARRRAGPVGVIATLPPCRRRCSRLRDRPPRRRGRPRVSGLSRLGISQGWANRHQRRREHGVLLTKAHLPLLATAAAAPRSRSSPAARCRAFTTRSAPRSAPARAWAAHERTDSHHGGRTGGQRVSALAVAQRCGAESRSRGRTRRISGASFRRRASRLNDHVSARGSGP
jgi:hypothetical protein